jgi:hypothetical protein
MDQDTLAVAGARQVRMIITVMMVLALFGFVANFNAAGLVVLLINIAVYRALWRNAWGRWVAGIWLILVVGISSIFIPWLLATQPQVLLILNAIIALVHIICVFILFFSPPIAAFSQQKLKIKR